MASLGFNPSGRAAALKAAVEQNKLPAAQARGMLPRHEWPAGWDPTPALDAGRPRPDAEAIRSLIAGVLEKKITKGDPDGDA
jgi:hypothetical protein